MKDLGPIGKLEGVYELSPLNWSVFFASEPEIVIEHSPEEYCLTLLVDIPLKNKPNIQLCVSMLKYNQLWKQNKGLSIALHNDESAIRFILPISTESLTIPILCDRLSNFYETAMAWGNIASHIKQQASIEPDGAFSPNNLQDLKV